MDNGSLDDVEAGLDFLSQETMLARAAQAALCTVSQSLLPAKCCKGRAVDFALNA